MSDGTVPLSLYSEALDEIYELRRALAYESLVRQADLGYKTFPKSRRDIAEAAVERMQAAARGKVSVTYAGTSAQILRYSLREAGADECLTRSQWENEKPRRSA